MLLYTTTAASGTSDLMRNACVFRDRLSAGCVSQRASAHPQCDPLRLRTGGHKRSRQLHTQRTFNDAIVADNCHKYASYSAVMCGLRGPG
jgi:hypothetical protein